MEHLVIRNASLNNQNLDIVDEMDLRKMKILTESLIGRMPSAFTAGEDGHSKHVHTGDLVWLAQAGYGVIGTLRISQVYPVAEVRSHAEIDVLKKDSRYSSLEATYWEHLRDRLPNLKGRAMYFASVAITVEQQFSKTDQFRLSLPPHFQQSWVVLTDSVKKGQFFSKRGQSLSAALAEEEAGGDYGAITPKVRLAVRGIWKDEFFGDRLPGEELHYDHFVPRALGGPGILAENIVPTPGPINQVKKHKLVPEFADVADAWGLLSEEEYRTWGSMFDNAATLENQRNLTKRITSTIRARPHDEQRKFYFQVLEKGVGPRVRTLFTEAGALPPNV